MLIILFVIFLVYNTGPLITIFKRIPSTSRTGIVPIGAQYGIAPSQVAGIAPARPEGQHSADRSSGDNSNYS